VISPIKRVDAVSRSRPASRSRQIRSLLTPLINTVQFLPWRDSRLTPRQDARHHHSRPQAQAPTAFALIRPYSRARVRTRNVVDVVFSFRHRETDVTDKFSTRVDVTEEFPFLVTKMSPYFDR